MWRTIGVVQVSRPANFIAICNEELGLLGVQVLSVQDFQKGGEKAEKFEALKLKHRPNQPDR